MNTNQNINAEKITKPIQLLAVWFTGLVLLESILLTAASIINQPSWIVPTLVISAILIIPLFLYFIFLLQTKYRPQMQEDTFYSRYLDKNTNTVKNVSKVVSASSGQNFDEFKLFLDTSINEIKEEIQKTKTINQEDLSTYLDKVKESISKKELEFENSEFRVTLNKLIPNSSKIRLALLREGIHIDEEWEGGGGKAPTKNLISFDRNVSPIFLSRILEILHPLGIEFVNLIPEEDRTLHLDEVLIGSYAYRSENRRLNKINTDLIETLKLMRNKNALIQYFE